MKSILVVVLTFFALISQGLALTEKEEIALVNSVNKRASAGDVSALDDLKQLNSSQQLGALILVFKSNFYAYKATAAQKAAAAKAAEKIPQVEGVEALIRDAWKKPAGGKSGGLGPFRLAIMDALGDLNSKLSVRMLAEALWAEDVGEQRKQVLRKFLAKGLPDAPYPKSAYPETPPKGAIGPEGLAKWKEWYEKHKADYAEKEKE